MHFTKDWNLREPLGSIAWENCYCPVCDNRDRLICICGDLTIFRLRRNADPVLFELRSEHRFISYWSINLLHYAGRHLWCQSAGIAIDPGDGRRPSSRHRHQPDSPPLFRQAQHPAASRASAHQCLAAGSRPNPGRSRLPVPERPKSSSITTTCLKPISRARSHNAYWSRPLSRLFRT